MMSAEDNSSCTNTKSVASIYLHVQVSLRFETKAVYIMSGKGYIASRSLEHWVATKVHPPPTHPHPPTHTHTHTHTHIHTHTHTHTHTPPPPPNHPGNEGHSLRASGQQKTVIHERTSISEVDSLTLCINTACLGRGGEKKGGEGRGGEERGGKFEMLQP